MAQFWLQDDDANTLNLDTNAFELTLGGNKRNFSFQNFLGADGATVRGWGSFTKKEFIVTRKERALGTDITAWNAERAIVMRWFTKPIYQNVWFYLTDGEGAETYRTKVYCTEIPADKYKFYKISDSRSFKITSPSGVLENTTATTDSEVYATAVTDDSVAITNDGILECPGIFSYTPTATEVIFKVKFYENYGFTLSITGINSGDKISYDTSDGTLTIADEQRNASSFLTSGSLFNLPAGDSTIYVSVTQPGTFEYSFNERVI